MLPAKELTFIQHLGRITAGVGHCCGMRFIARPDVHQPDQIRDDILHQFGQHKCAPSQGLNAELLFKLKWLLTKEGYISENLVNKTAGMPSQATIYHHLGSFRQIYRMLGYHPRKGVFTQSVHRRQTYHIRDELIRQLKNFFPDRMRVLRSSARRRPELEFDSKHLVSISICRARRTRDGRLEWLFIPVPKNERDHAVLLCLLDESNTKRFMCYLLPSAKMSSRHFFKQDDPMLAAGIQVDDLSQTHRNVDLFKH
jgi:hypothetical protein